MAYIIVVYDVSVERQEEVREFLKKFLNHVQRSVFEGEIEESKVFYIKKYLSKVIDKERDSIIIYVLRNNWCLKNREVLGAEKEFGIY